MKTRATKTLAVLLVGVSLAACGAKGDAPARAAAPAANLTTSGVNATMTVDSWGGGYCANITLANTSTSAVTSWTLVAALNGTTLNNLWGGTSSASGGLLTIKPVDYNTNIAPSASVTLGFCGTGSGTPALDSLTVVGPSGPTNQTLTVTKSGQGVGTVTSTPSGVSCGTTCSASFASGTVVTLTAAASSGSTFGGWSGACTGTAATCTVTMSAAQSVAASFLAGPTSYPLTVVRSSTSMGFGTVTSSPAGIACDFTSTSTCTASFLSTATVTLTATVTGQNTFDGWSGPCTGRSPTCIVAMTAAQTVTATFGFPDAQYSLVVAKAGTGSGTVTSAPSGIVCGSTCSTTFASGTAVTLTATPASGSAFTGWSGPCTGSAPTCIVTATSSLAVTATFDLSDPGTALSVNVGGAAAGTFVADAYYSGGSTYSTTNAVDTTQLTGSVPAQAVLQTERYGEFTYTIPNRAAGGAQTVTLYFVESYWTAAGQRTFNVAINGTTVLTAFDIFAAAGGANKAIARTFNATANSSGQVVIAFTKGGGPDNPKVCGISVAGGVAPTYSLTVTKAGTGSGSVSGGGIDCGTTCSAQIAAGTPVTLTAAAASGSVFTGWSGACSGSSATCTVSMTAAQSVTASFTQGTSYSLTVTKGGTGSGTVTSTPAGINCGSTCTASYTSGTAVTLTASPGTGGTFTGWSGACAGTANCIVTMTANQTATANFSGSRPSTFSNPVIYQDLADGEIIRVDNTYYYSASTMHYSPGAPILRSYDLVNWEYVGHSVPAMDFNNAYSLIGGRQYVNGIWASSLKYRKSNSTFYWMGCLHNAGGGVLYTATDVKGPWTKHNTPYCYYDVGLLIDDDDTMYTASGNTTISVAQLSKDGLSQVRSQVVYTSGSEGALEGSRFYKINGYYYIFVTQYANGEYVLRASSPFGPYTLQKFAVKVPPPITPDPSYGNPHQGGIVQTQNGDWYYMAFIDAYPGGRSPVLAPMTWSNGWPSVTLVNGGWAKTYPFPNLPYTPVKPLTGTDTFAGTALGPEWEWNHNPDTTKFSVNNKLTLQTATVTNDLYNARNTLTHRIQGPTSTATIVLNYGTMKDGDRAGMVLLRNLSAWIGVKRDGGQYRVAFVNNLNMDGSWNTTSTGTEVTGTGISGGKIWLRIAADITPGANRQARFSYSTDGSSFTQLGTYTMGDAYNFFMGYRYGIFNYATSSLGGSVTVDSFTMTTP